MSADIIRMAKEADVDKELALWDWQIRLLTRFHELAAAAERKKHQTDIERWKAEAATAQKWRALALAKDGSGQSVQLIQQEAAAIEREACAKVCEYIETFEDAEAVSCIAEASAAIRARGNQPPAL